MHPIIKDSDLLIDEQDTFFKKKYRSYLSDLKKFMNQGYSLPSTTQDVISYLLNNKNDLSPRTLKRHIASLSWWHKRSGYHDVTKSPDVMDQMSHIAAKFNRPTKQAPPLIFSELKQVIQYIDDQLKPVHSTLLIPPDDQLKLLRDRTIFCIGFWKAYRSSDLAQITYSDINQKHGQLYIHIKKGKGDRSATGKEYPLDAVNEEYAPTCPVKALNQWLIMSQITSGPLFPSIRTFHDEKPKPLSSDAINTIIKQYTNKVGLIGYSSHSLRSGFTTEFFDSMGLKQLTDYVGWSSIEYASTYVRDNKNLPFAISKTNKSKNKETGKGINPLPALLINNNNR